METPASTTCPAATSSCVRRCAGTSPISIPHVRMGPPSSWTSVTCAPPPIRRPSPSPAAPPAARPESRGRQAGGRLAARARACLAARPRLNQVRLRLARRRLVLASREEKNSSAGSGTTLKPEEENNKRTCEEPEGLHADE